MGSRPCELVVKWNVRKVASSESVPCLHSGFIDVCFPFLACTAFETTVQGVAKILLVGISFEYPKYSPSNSPHVTNCMLTPTPKVVMLRHFMWLRLV